MKQPWLWLSLIALFGPVQARAVIRTAPAPDGTLDLPIRQVTVFSDRARIERTADVRFPSGLHAFVLPALPATADPDSVRVEASGAIVARVEVARATLDEFPRNQAQKLLDQINALRDEMTGIQNQLTVLQNEQVILQQIRPTPVLQSGDRAAPALLNPSGWQASLRFLDERQAALDDEMVPLEAQQKAKQKEIDQAVAQAQQIAAGNSAQNQVKVTAFIDGTGRVAQVSLIYMAANAVWRPAYDVRFTPGENTIEVGYSAYVAQQTGEDWTDAQLVLSTAVPTTTATLPELAVWKIGDEERFIPTPDAAPAVAPTRISDEEQPPFNGPATDDAEQLRVALLQAANSAPAAANDGERSRRHLRYRAPMKEAEIPRAYAAPVPMAPPPPSAEYDGAQAGAAAMPVPEAMMSRTVAAPAGGPSTPTRSISFGAPVGWRSPVFAGDLPASLAGGYTFTYPSARPESIRSGGEVRRVPLFSQRFPATPYLKILPALSKHAFLVAEITNAGKRPLLGGQAHLFVGADLVGDAMVRTTAVGQKVTLPLGIDDAVRVERNVSTIESQRGVFTKQDVNAYEVVIELLNPRARTVQARVVDQVPLAEQKDVEISLDQSNPPTTFDKTDGTIEWELALPSGQKKTLSFTYSLARPKDSRLSQHSAPAVGEH